MTTTSTPLFEERRSVTAATVWVALALAAGCAWFLWEALRDGAEIASLLPIVGGVAVLGAALVAISARVGGLAGPGDHVRVDADGLTVGKRHLAATRIGEVSVVRAGLAAALSAQGFVERDDRTRLDIPRGHSTYAALGSSGRAVLVEDRPGRAWLLATRDPEGLAVALEAARDGGAGR
jgi:hypothetical protein